MVAFCSTVVSATAKYLKFHHLNRLDHQKKCLLHSLIYITHDQLDWAENESHGHIRQT